MNGLIPLLLGDSVSVPPLPPSLAPPCLPCVEGRQRAAPHSSSFPLTTAPLQTLHLDVWGPARIQGQGRERYFLLVVDDYSRYTTVFPLRSKGEVPDVLIPWIRAVRLQLRERGPVAAPSGPVAALCGHVAALRGPVAAPSGPAAALHGPVAASSGPVALRGPVAASTGPVAALRGPFTAEPPSSRAAEPPSRPAAEPPSRPAAEPPSSRAAEPPSSRPVEPPSRPAAEPLPSSRYCHCRAAATAVTALFLPARRGPTHSDCTVRSQWATRDAAARLAVRRHLPTTERAHFSQYKSAKTLYDAVVTRYSSPATAALSRLMLPYLFPDLAAFPTVADLITHLRTSDTRYCAALPAEFYAKNHPPMYITLYYIVTRLPDSLRLVRDHFLSVCPTTLTVDLLKERLLAAEKSIVAVGASRGDPRTLVFEGCSPSPLLPSVASPAAADLVGFESVSAASALSGRRRTGKGKGGKGAGGAGGGGGGGGGGSGGGGGGGGSGGGGGGIGGSSVGGGGGDSGGGSGGGGL
ncbi:unnamed protein product [Closterium sp. NIES-65]|nr:unnamed protein product [Closterium sp. NIES-65]